MPSFSHFFSHLIVGWSKLDGYIFTAKICEQTNDHSMNMTLKDCSDSCEGNSTCNAINWAANETDRNVGGHCVFWKCPQPLPTFFEEPAWNWTSYYNFGKTSAFPSEESSPSDHLHTSCGKNLQLPCCLHGEKPQMVNVIIGDLSAGNAEVVKQHIDGWSCFYVCKVCLVLFH